MCVPTWLLQPCFRCCQASQHVPSPAVAHCRPLSKRKAWKLSDIVRKEHVYDPDAAAVASEQRLQEREAAAQAALAAEQAAEAEEHAEAHGRQLGQPLQEEHRHAVAARGFAASGLPDVRPVAGPGDVEPEQGAQPDLRPHP